MELFTNDATFDNDSCTFLANNHVYRYRLTELKFHASGTIKCIASDVSTLLTEFNSSTEFNNFINESGFDVENFVKPHGNDNFSRPIKTE